MQSIHPDAVRFIKLGSGGKWEESCIQQENTIRLGYSSPFHQECLNGHWDKVGKFWLEHRKGKASTASNDLRQIQDFYQLDEKTLWITFYGRKLYWCFCDREVALHGSQDGSRVRRVRGKWSCKDINGNDLLADGIDGRITKVQAYRGTICKVERETELITKINGEKTPLALEAEENYLLLKKSVKDLMRELWWKDFELLTDLIFSRSGWQRISPLGKVEKDIDMVMVMPVTEKMACVQVKSQANIGMLKDLIREFKNMSQYSEFFFVVHTSDESLKMLHEPKKGIYVLDLDLLAELVINTGLVKWLINRRG